MIKNRRRSKLPIILAIVGVIAAAVLIYLNFNPVKRTAKEEYFPGGNLSQDPDNGSITYTKAGELTMTYDFSQTAFSVDISDAEWKQLENGIAAKVDGTQYVYIGAYKLTEGPLATVLNEAPLFMSESYNRNGSHADTKVSSEGYICGRSAEYDFVLLEADLGNNETEDYYAAFYGIKTNDEEYGIVICSFTEGTSDGAKDYCVSWIDTITATLKNNSSFVKTSDEEDFAYTPTVTDDSSKNEIAEVEIEDIEETEEVITPEENGEEEEKTEAGEEDTQNSSPGTSGTGSAGTQTGNTTQTETTPSTQTETTPSTQTETTPSTQTETTPSTQTETTPSTQTETAPSTQTETTPAAPSATTDTGTGSENTETQPTPAVTPTTPSTPAYDGSGDLDSNSFDSPIAGAGMSVSIWTSNSVDGVSCYMVRPDGQTVYGSGSGTSFSIYDGCCMEGTYTVYISHRAKIGSWGASINFGG